MLNHKITKADVDMGRDEVGVSLQVVGLMSKKLSYFRVGDRVWWKVVLVDRGERQVHLFNRVESAIEKYNNIGAQ